MKKQGLGVPALSIITSSVLLSACGGGGGGNSAAPAPSLASQTIAAFNIPTLAVGASASITTAASSGLPVSYRSTTTNTCTVSGNTVTAVSLGTCNITASQAGNASFTAAQDVAASMIVGAQSINLTIPALMVGQTYPITASTTSGLPVVLNSTTPSTCTVIAGMLLSVTSTAAGSCTVNATQAGNNRYAPATPVTVTAAINIASSVVASGAIAIPASLPQAGSTAADSTTTTEGVYENAQGFGFMDAQNHLNYFDPTATIFGQVQFSGSTWSFLKPTLVYTGSQYTNVNPVSNNVEHVTNIASIVTGSGLFLSKKYLIATAQSFPSTPSTLSLIYGPANGYALTQASLAGSWIYNTGTQQFQLSITNTGAITGTFADSSSSLCSLTGAITLTEPDTNHNLFNIIFKSADVPNSGVKCTMGTTQFRGLGGMRYFAATSNSSNGVLPALSFIMLGDNTANFPMMMFRQS